MSRQPIQSEVLDLILDQAFPGLPKEEHAALKQSYAFLAQWIARLPRELPYDQEPSHLFVAPKDQR
jgi:hypothetical protein